MPITITLPPPGGAIGPGFYVVLSSDFIGPLGSLASFTIRVSTDAEFVTHVYSENFQAFSHIEGVQLALPQTGNSSIPDQVVADGTSVHVQALLNGGSGIVDSGSTTATWRPTQMAWEQTATIQPSSGAGGLTVPQAQELADNHAAINPPLLAHDGTPITGGVGDVITRPALKFLGIDTTAHVLTGSGTLTCPTFAGVQITWGLVLDVTGAPPGASYKAGYVTSYHPRVGQFLLLWPAKNTAEAMVLSELRLHLEHFTWSWDFANVQAVGYYIEPGWEVTARFWTAFFP